MGAAGRNNPAAGPATSAGCQPYAQSVRGRHYAAALRPTTGGCSARPQADGPAHLLQIAGDASQHSAIRAAATQQLGINEADSSDRSAHSADRRPAHAAPHRRSLLRWPGRAGGARGRRRAAAAAQAHACRCRTDPCRAPRARPARRHRDERADQPAAWHGGA